MANNILLGILVIWFLSMGAYLLRQAWYNWQDYKSIRKWSRHERSRDR